jgi:hypothetical protein
VSWLVRSGRVLGPFALYAIARQLDAALGTLLHTTLDLPGFPLRAAALLEPRHLAGAASLGAAAGTAVWLVLAASRSRSTGEPLAAAAAAEAEAGGFAPLLLRPAVTVLAWLALALHPTFPYAATLPVALSQDWSVALDAAILVGLVAPRLRAVRLPAPRALSVFGIAFLIYAVAVPERARSYEGHPGNEPKYLRMALALGHRLSLDVEGIEGSMEQLPVRPFGDAAADAASSLTRESGAMLASSFRGEVGLDAIRAGRITRQTIYGKHGGVYHVLAPGPSFVLAPLLRADRWLNLELGTPGRLRLSMLGWNAIAAALVAALFLLVRDVTGRAGLAALVAAVAAAAPPYLFYFYQFYPEMPGALMLALALRQVFFSRRWSVGSCLGLGLILASLPWWHQKFLPVWAVLALLAAIRAVDRLVSLRALLALAIPQLASGLATALYNFAITGSVRPDALFRAWGPGGVTTAHLPQGFFGLALDINYGLLPYAPVYLAAFAGLLQRGRAAAALRLAFPAFAVYYLTVAAADDWHGAVSHLGRYAMPATPYAIALIAVVLARIGSRPGVLTAILTLTVWTGLCARQMWLDPHAADDARRLAEKSEIADVSVYVPDLFVPTMGDGAPGLPAQLAVWLAIGLGLALWMRRTSLRGAGRSPSRALLAMLAAALALSAALERWPSPHRLPRFRSAVEIEAGVTAFPSDGRLVGDPPLIVVRGDETELLVRSREPLRQLPVLAAGTGFGGPAAGPLSPIRERGRWLGIPLETVAALEGRRGVREWLYRAKLRFQTRGEVTLRLSRPGGEE